jgi:hypothetical protein
MVHLWAGDNVERRRHSSGFFLGQLPGEGRLRLHRGTNPSDGGHSVTHTNNSGQYRDFQLIPNLDTLKLSGFCNWRKAWQRAPG